MKAGDFDSVISSPPYEGIPINQTHMTSNKRGDESNPNYRPSWKKKLGEGYAETTRPYGFANGQLGETSGVTFWRASAEIVGQCHAILKPHGVAIWVVKDFVRKKAIVPFCDQWRQLCEAQGFETVEMARAWLVEDKGEQMAFDGNHKRRVVESKSFFRRLAEKKGSPRIDWETVLFMRKA